MVTRIIVSVVAVLALSAGVAYAATELTSSDGTQVCVNNTNGLMRVATTCREGEYPLTIGGDGGGDVQVTQNGTFTVSASGQSAAKTLPLTGIGVSGVCFFSSGLGIVIPRVELTAAIGETMDIWATNFVPSNAPNIGIGSALLLPGGTSPGAAFVTSNDATATIQLGASASQTTTPKTCSFFWQAVEAPNY